MATTKKAQVVSEDLAARLAIRLPSLVVSQSVDTADNNPVITISDGTPASTEQVVVIKIMQASVTTVSGGPNLAVDPWPYAKDILGNTANSYSPLLCQVAWEDGTTVFDTYLTAPNLLAVMGEVLRLGTIVQLWVETNATVPSATTFQTASKLKATFDNLYYPLVGAV